MVSLNKLARKVFHEALKDYDGQMVNAEDLFVQAFILGFMYNEDIGNGDVKLVLFEEQLDLPIH